MNKKILILNQWMVFVFFLGIFIFCSQSLSQQSKDMYDCYKTDEKINVDGRLLESCWQKTKEIKLKDMIDGSEPFFQTTAKMLWDDNYLYIGFECEDTDVWARMGLKDSEIPETLIYRITRKRQGCPPEWYRLEAEIMHLEKFVKVFLDPDADESNYLELHITPINNIFDAWYTHGLQDITTQTWESPNVRWSCPGLVTAVYIDGTLNAPHDIDRGWSVEIAIFWKSIKFLAKGACPPKNGDIWTVLLCRLHRPGFWSQGSKRYWSWPVVGKLNCHILSTYGRVRFLDNSRRFLGLFSSGSGEPEQIILQAKEIGVTDFIVTGDEKPIQRYVEVGKKYGIRIYAMIFLNNIGLWKNTYPETEVPLQKMKDEEEKLKEYFKNKDNRISSGYQMGEIPKAKNKEVLYTDLLCFHDERVISMFKKEIDRLAKISGITGIMFDFFGYQNYYGCFCKESMKKFEKYLQMHPDIDRDKAFEQFSLETLVSFYQELIEYIHSKNSSLKTFAHIYPVFLPEPFYGSRTGLDYWSQTIAWYFPRDKMEIAIDTKKMLLEEKKYHQNTISVGMLGYYNRPDLYPLKTAERFEMELKTMLENGCQYVFVYSFNDVLKSPEIKEVLKKYFKR